MDTSPDTAGEWVIWIGIFISVVVVPLWALISIVGLPKLKWQAAHKSKGLWLALVILFTLFTAYGGTIVGLIYLIFVAPKVRSFDYRQGYTSGMGSSSIADLPPDDPRRKASGL